MFCMSDNQKHLKTLVKPRKLSSRMRTTSLPTEHASRGLGGYPCPSSGVGGRYLYLQYILLFDAVISSLFIGQQPVNKCVVNLKNI